jgi:hypothetical protein
MSGLTKDHSVATVVRSASHRQFGRAFRLAKARDQPSVPDARVRGVLRRVLRGAFAHTRDEAQLAHECGEQSPARARQVVVPAPGHRRTPCHRPVFPAHL